MDWNVFHGQENIGRIPNEDNYQEAYKRAMILAKNKKGEKFDPNKVRIRETTAALFEKPSWYWAAVWAFAVGGQPGSSPAPILKRLATRELGIAGSAVARVVDWEADVVEDVNILAGAG